MAQMGSEIHIGHMMTDWKTYLPEKKDGGLVFNSLTLLKDIQKGEELVG